MILAEQGDDEILSPRGFVAVALEPRVRLSKLASYRGDFFLSKTRGDDKNRGETY
jgi:hypothetical protein